MLVGELQTLTKGLGIWRPDLKSSVGDGLRNRWHIVEDEKSAILRVKVQWQLNQIIKTLPTRRQELLAGAAFNIADPRFRDVLLGKRQEALGKSHDLPGSRSRSEITKDTRILLEDIAETLSLERPPPTPEEVLRRLHSPLSAGGREANSQEARAKQTAVSEPSDQSTIERLVSEPLTAVPQQPVEIPRPFPRTSAEAAVDKPPAHPLTRICEPDLQHSDGASPTQPNHTRRRRGLLIGLPLGAVTLTTTIVLLAVHLFSGADDGKSDLGVKSLDARVLRLTGGGLQSFAFSQSQMAAASQVIREYGKVDPNRSETAKSYFDKALDSGAYLLADAGVTLELTGNAPKEIIVYDVRLVNLTRAPMATGALVLNPPQGDSNELLYFDLDSPAPTAHTREGDIFFDLQHISVPHGDKSVLFISLNTMRGAFSFDIAVDFEVGGQQYTQIVTRGGDHFRVTATPCLSESEKAHLTEEEEQEMRALRYSEIRGPSNHLIFARPDNTVDPEAYAQYCWS